MIKTIQKSVFFNIISVLAYIELIVLLITFTTTTSIISFLDPIFEVIWKILIPLERPIGECVLVASAFAYFFPLFSSIIVVACTIAGIFEIKQSHINGYILNISSKKLDSKFYKTIFVLGIILTITMCILRIPMGVLCG